MPSGTEQDYRPLPAEYPPAPASQQPPSNIERHYNQLLRPIKELIAMINGSNAGNDINGNPLNNYTGVGIMERLTAIEDQGKIQDSDKVQIGTTLTIGNRFLRFILGAMTTYVELFWDNSDQAFSLRNEGGALQRLKIQPPIVNTDAATKGYVDSVAGGGLLARFCQGTAPRRTGNRSLSIDWLYSQDSTGTKLISIPNQTTINLNISGLNGLMASTMAFGIEGTVNVSSGGATVTGTGTKFTEDFIVNEWLQTAGGQIRRISAIASDTSMTVSSNFSTTETGVYLTRGDFLVGGAMWGCLYALTDGLVSGYGISYRNTLGGETLVDMPRIPKTGTATIISSQSVVNGTGTQFLTEFEVGMKFALIVGSNYHVGIVQSIQSNTQLTLDTVAVNSVSNSNVFSVCQWYRQLPYSLPLTPSTANLLEHEVTGFPHATALRLVSNDTSFSIPITGQTNTTAASMNLLTNHHAPRLCNGIEALVTAQAVNNSAVSGQFFVGPDSSALWIQATPVTIDYNSSNYAILQGRQFFTMPIGSSKLLWYQAANSNTSGSVKIYGYHFGDWR